MQTDRGVCIAVNDFGRDVDDAIAGIQRRDLVQQVCALHRIGAQRDAAQGQGRSDVIRIAFGFTLRCKDVFDGAFDHRVGGKGGQSGNNDRAAQIA